MRELLIKNCGLQFRILLKGLISIGPEGLFYSGKMKVLRIFFQLPQPVLKIRSKSASQTVDALLVSGNA